MQDYVIITDSTGDLSPQTLEREKIQVAPLTFSFGSEQYRDLPGGQEMDRTTFFQRLRSGEMPTTAQVSPRTFFELFSSILQNGRDLLYIAFSGAMSGTYQTAKMVAEKLASIYPKQKIMILDSLSGSMGQGMLVDFAAKLKQSGKCIQEVYDRLLEKRIRAQHWFTVNDLNFLKRGGRISAALAQVGSILNIKPILTVNKIGQIIPYAKIRGRKKSMTFLVDRLAETLENPDEEVVFVSHADCQEDGQELASLIQERVSPKEVILNWGGPIISSHCGPGALGVFFFGKPRAT
jgi:DegV family protein with EDD domain